jgi:hypothetical protein
VGVIFKFKNLGQALKSAFPEFDWELEKFSEKGKKSIQGWYEEGGRGQTEDEGKGGQRG